MSNKFHIIVTGESGGSLSIQISKRKVLVSACSFIVAVIALGIFSYQTTGSYLSNKLLNRKVADLQTQLEHIRESNEHYSSRIETLKDQHLNEVASLQKDFEEEMADQKIRFDLENTNLQLENIRLMTTAVNDLNQRSELIESIMGTIGVELKKPGKQKSQENTGGPYIPVEDSSYDTLLKQVDKYMETIRTMPLGKPLNGSISSGFGKRTDPVNKKNSFHEGVDIRGKKGDKIYATASGTVLRAFKNGSYGNYVEIDHGNGYTTAYAHLQNYLVKKGEHIKQGQIIGQVGNSGRSTGPHLHYEVRLNQKPINPTKFMKVAELSHTFDNNTEAEADIHVQ